MVLALPRPLSLKNVVEDESQGKSLPSLDPVRMLVNSVSLFFAGLTLLIAIGLAVSYKGHLILSKISGIGGNMQFTERSNWLPITPGHWVQYHLGVDGISILLILLTALLTLLSVIYSMRVPERGKEVIALLLILEGAIFGAYSSLDLLLFYLFFEATLIPAFLLLGLFGYERRGTAAMRFFLYTFAGSVLMLVSLAAIYHYTGTFDMVALANPYSSAYRALHGVNPQILLWMFAAFAFAFGIKTPIVPFHGWLPEAYVQAPAVGSIALVLLKTGVYGFIRICLPIFPGQAMQAAPLFIAFGILGILYGSMLAIVQTDAKKVVAYSSVAQMGFVILGIFSFTRIGLMGALALNLSHGLTTPMLFFIIGMLYDRRRSHQISDYGGLKKVTPLLATMLLIATLGSIAVPLFSGFIGEFPVLLGSWISSVTMELGGYVPTAFAATGMILSAIYMLWWFQRLMLGPLTSDENRKLPDLTRREWMVLTPLAAAILWMGIGSHFWTAPMNDPVNLILPIRLEQVRGDLPVAAKLDEERARLEEGVYIPTHPQGYIPAPLEVRRGIGPRRRPLPERAHHPAPAIPANPNGDNSNP